MHVLSIPAGPVISTNGDPNWTQFDFFSRPRPAGSGGRLVDMDDVWDGLILWVDPTIRIFAVWSDEALSTDTQQHILNDLVRPKLLAFDGQLVLHGGLSGTATGAIGFIGGSGQGKSTLTASLHETGLSLISDDAFVVQAGTAAPRAHRLYPSLRLFPDSLSRLFPAAPVTSAVAENTDKRRVPFEVGPPEAPLLALFVLADPADTIRAERLTPAEACMEIIANSFSFDRNDPAEARGRLARAADLARLLPVFDLHYPRDYAALSDVHACIFETLGLAPPDKASA